MSNNHQKNLKLVLAKVPGADESIVIELLNEMSTVEQVIAKLQSGDRSTVWTSARGKPSTRPAQRPAKTDNNGKKPWIKNSERPQREYRNNKQEQKEPEPVLPPKPASPWANLNLTPMNQPKPAAPAPVPVQEVVEAPKQAEERVETQFPALTTEEKPVKEVVVEEPVKVEEVKEVVVEEPVKVEEEKPKVVAKPVNVLRLPSSIASLKVRRDNFGSFGRVPARKAKAAPKVETAPKAPVQQPARQDFVPQPYFTYVPFMIDPAAMEGHAPEGHAPQPFMMPHPMGPYMMPPPQGGEIDQGKQFQAPGAMPYPYPFFPYGAQPPMHMPPQQPNFQ